MSKTFENKTKIQGTKIVCAIALILILTFSGVGLTSMLIVKAQSSLVPTYAYSIESPNPVGLNQACGIGGWVSPPPLVAGQVYYNFTFTVTDPSGVKTTILVPSSRVEATASVPFTCNQLGTWSVVLSYPGDAQHAAAISPPYSWIVQNTSIPETPHIPLPTGYWTFPINAENWEWYQISGPWYTGRGEASFDQYNPYSTGPNTSHILWRNQVVPGGIIGGAQGYNSFSGEFNESECNIGLTNYVAADGRLYYTTNQYQNNSAICSQPILHCVNQATGQQIYAVVLNRASTPPLENNAPVQYTLWLDLSGTIKAGEADQSPLTNGADFIWVSGNGLWCVNAFNGDVVFYWAGRTGVYWGGDVYVTNYPTTGKLTAFPAATLQQDNLTALWNITAGLTYISDDGIIVQRIDSTSNVNIMRVNTWNATTGAVIAVGPEIGIDNDEALAQCVYMDKIYLAGADLRMHALSLLTGAQVWQSEPMSYPWGSFASYGQSAAYGMVYQGMLDGHIYAWNATTGALVWTYFSGNTTNTPYGTYPFWGNIVIADGKLYADTGEHTPSQPYPMGYSLYCLNAYNGSVIWNYPGFSTYTFAHVAFGEGISSGMLWYQNNQDGCLYMFGTGLSATSVSASPKVMTQGSNVLIEGTVTDLSPGQTGTPAISDASMSDWMAHLYENAPMPTNATGVPVTVTAFDPNNNTEVIGTTTSDASGNYAIAFTPPVPGLYTITATFYGTNSYYSSKAETHIDVATAASPAAVVTPAPTQQPTSTSTSIPVQPTPTIAQTPSPVVVPPSSPTPVTATYVAIGVAVIIVIAVAAALILRRRK